MRVEIIKRLFNSQRINFRGNFIYCDFEVPDQEQTLTNRAFSLKWSNADKKSVMDKTLRDQKDWFLKLYGFETEEKLKQFLRSQEVILDAGCGLGYKTAWFAELSPESLVLGMDFSEAAKIAANIHNNIPNLFFIQADIAETGIKSKSVNFINCDQVIHHTSDPEHTFRHLAGRLKKGGEFNCYVYASKGLPRELLDDYFRENVGKITEEKIWELSEQLTELGRTLSELDISITVPEIPLLDIKGGEYDLQRFVYWNFIKCYWNPEQGYDASVLTNFDWYAPKNAYRYTLEEFKKMVRNNNLEIVHLHTEKACHAGRFRK